MEGIAEVSSPISNVLSRVSYKNSHIAEGFMQLSLQKLKTDGDVKTSLSNLFCCLTVLMVKLFFLISSLNLCCFNLHSFFYHHPIMHHCVVWHCHFHNFLLRICKPQLDFPEAFSSSKKARSSGSLLYPSVFNQSRP